METNFYSRLFEHMERELLNSFRSQFHSFFIFHLSLSLYKNSSCAFGTEFIILYFFGTLTLCPFSFFLSVFSKVLSSWVQHPQETFGLHNVVIALFEEERLFEEEEEEEEEEKRHNSRRTNASSFIIHIYIYISRKEAR